MPSPPGFGNVYLGDLSVQDAVPPEPGTTISDFKIEAANAENLVLRPNTNLAYALIAVGVALLGFCYFSIYVGLISLVLVGLGLSIVGTVYSVKVDAVGRIFSRTRWMDGTKTWEPGSIHEISFIARAPSEDHKNLAINIYHAKSEFVICLYTNDTGDAREMHAAIATARFIAKILRVPARVYGDLSQLPPEFQTTLKPPATLIS